MHWLELILGIVGLIAAIHWGRPAAIAGWILGLFVIVGHWIVALAAGEDALWTFMILVGFGGLVWAVLGGVAAVQALSYRALRREAGCAALTK